MPELPVTLSIVSHRQNRLVNQLLEDVQRVCAPRVALVVTENARDAVPIGSVQGARPDELILNQVRRGFGANHNAAFRHCRTPYFCVCNPDVRLTADPFPALLAVMAAHGAAVAGPLVRLPDGRIEDSARRFPSVPALARKLFVDRRVPDYACDRGALEVDWVAGMFMLFSSDAFRAAGGFDEAYFLYYEDVDICRRLQAAGGRVLYEPRAEVVHDARRGSRRNPLLALHHLASAVRFLASRAPRA